MSKYHQAADTLKREASRYAALNEAAKALDEIGSLDQAATEAKSRAIANTAEADSIRADIDKLKISAKKLADAQAEKQKEADNIYAQSIAEANAKHYIIVAEAQAKAEKIASEAKIVAEQNIQTLSTQIESMDATKVELLNNIAILIQNSVIANADADAAERRLAKVKSSIAQLAGA